MTDIPSKEELEDFAINFEKKIVAPLVAVGYDQCNVFDILNIKRQELRHSDFLAYLFDPNKSGDIGQQFLKNFLVSLAQKKKISGIELFDILYGTIKHVNVYREYTIPNNQRRIDILIDFEIERNQDPTEVVIAIENKVDSDQHDNQLECYKDFLEKDSKYKKYKQIMLYLTTDSADPNNTRWKSINYEFIAEILKDLKTESIDKSISTLIEDYRKIIRSEFMDKSESKKVALEIYQIPENRRILDFIFECRPGIKEISTILGDLLIAEGATLKTENNGKLTDNTNKGLINIIFTTKDLDDGYYFQLCVDEMLLLFRENSGKYKYNQQWLFGNRQKSKGAIERFKELVVTDPKLLETECKQLIDQIFTKPDGAIHKALATLKK